MLSFFIGYDLLVPLISEWEVTLSPSLIGRHLHRHGVSVDSTKTCHISCLLSANNVRPHTIYPLWTRRERQKQRETNSFLTLDTHSVSAIKPKLKVSDI